MKKLTLPVLSVKKFARTEKRCQSTVMKPALIAAQQASLQYLIKNYVLRHVTNTDGINRFQEINVYINVGRASIFRAIKRVVLLSAKQENLSLLMGRIVRQIVLIIK